jgi:hypothetical protein
MEQIKQLDNKQLLDLLETNNEQVDLHVLNDDISNFLRFYNIVPGENQIEKRILHRLYKKWSKEPMNQAGFTLNLKDRLPMSNNNIYINLTRINVDKLVLEKLAKQKKVIPTTSVKQKKKFESFLSKFEISDGDYWFKAVDLFKLMKTFLNTKLRQKTFNDLLKLYIKQHDVLEEELCFKLNDSVVKHLMEYNESQKAKKKTKSTKQT